MLKNPPNKYMALLYWAVIVISVREIVFAIASHYHLAHAANLTGLFVLLALLLLVKKFHALPQWLLDANGIVMKESGFALLPYTAGAVGLLALLGSSWKAFVFINIISTLPFMLLLAWLAQKYVFHNTSHQ